MRKLWSDVAWEDYIYWQGQDRKTLLKINRLIKEIERAGFTDKPLGKAELLKGSKHGLCSVRIDKENRLVYKVESEDLLLIVSCRGHYR